MLLDLKLVSHARNGCVTCSDITKVFSGSNSNINFRHKNCFSHLLCRSPRYHFEIHHFTMLLVLLIYYYLNRSTSICSFTTHTNTHTTRTPVLRKLNNTAVYLNSYSNNRNQMVLQIIQSSCDISNYIIRFFLHNFLYYN